jgi:hypothetical protein
VVTSELPEVGADVVAPERRVVLRITNLSTDRLGHELEETRPLVMTGAEVTQSVVA